MEHRNIHKRFDPLIEESLGHYVYVLSERTADGRLVPFYVGKGGGKSGSGNARLLDHFEEARVALDKGGKQSRKIERIHAVWKSDDVQWHVLRHNICDKSGEPCENRAFAIESAAIDALTLAGFDLANEQKGHKSGERGLIAAPTDVYAKAAKQFDASELPNELLDRPILLFPANHSSAKAASISEAIREAWTVGSRFLAMPSKGDEKNPIALAVIGGISRAAISVDGWEPIDPNASAKKWRIVSEREVGSKLADSLVFKNFSELLGGYWQRGNWIGIQVSSTSNRVEFLRGRSPIE